MNNREIKFRAWDDSEKKMVYSDTAWSWFSDVYMPKPVKEEDILMQYTGLTDKNGEDIYEGDIYKTKTSNFNPYKEKQEIKFENVVAEVPRFPGQLYHLVGEAMFEPETVEVIGNIYENPELIEN